MNKLDEYAERKALLVLKSDLDRIRLTIAVRQVRAIFAPPVAPERAVWAAPLAGTLVGLALPLVGTQRLTFMVRTLSIALTAYRAIRNWRTSRPL